ncbi:right-handed parallel beta-helix repeat-containing protein [Glutamicibacter sp. BW77]|uniref:right-handed parallel beta-helix repeat-containing protein n=1 Tax=Glutamicibacter TaxID=1742989 RepID=UPI000BB88DCC|nr:right-handed parallel beta-helix repeat-containing protein [Glutamicibacter sp. BW77]PCC34457.1 hypothetical protein CIK74_10590 [Glutamicibacter sp. BW77]
MSSSVNKIPRFRSVRRYGTLALAAAVLSAGLTALDAPATTAAQATANDSFARTTSNGWGTATSGGPYSTWHSSNTKMSVNNGQARITGLVAGGSSVATLKSVTSTDVAAQGDITFTKLPSSKTTVYAALEVRRQSDDSSYRGRIIGKTDSNATLQLSRTNKGKETHLGSFTLPFKVKTGEQVRLELKATGTTQVELSARAWVVGQKTPAWQLSKTDKSSDRIKASGNFGFWTFASGNNPGAVDLAVDNLSLAPAAASQPEVTAPETSKPEPITPPVINSSRGAGTLGSANYAVPSNAIYVASNVSGTQSGTKAAPLGSLQKAIDTSKNGQTIVLRGGTYHQSATVPYGKDNLTIQNYPGEKVWLDGTKAVTNWKKSGSTWVASGWTSSFSNKLLNVANNTRFVDPKNPLAAHPDMLFVNGKQLKQVANAASVVPGTFAVNYATDQLILGDDPTNKSVTASALGQAMSIVGKNATVQGFGIRGYATAYDSERAALQMQNIGATVRNIQIIDNAMTGLAVQNNDSTIDNVTATGNGMLGISVNSAYNSAVTDTIASNNNVEKFKPQPVAGGIKVTRSRGMTLDNLEINRNTGMGLWLDESVYDFTVTNVQANNNTSVGIEAELSSKGIIANNEALNNKTGILLFDTGNVKIYNNNLGGNSLMGLQLSQDERRQSNKSFAGQDPRRPVPDSTVPWLTQNIEVANNIFDKSGSFQFYTLDKATGISADKMKITIKGNLFSARPTTSTATMVAWGGSDNKKLYRYESPSALSSAKNSTWKNHQTSTAKLIGSMSADRTQANSMATPLPTDVAKAIGSTAGKKVVGKH